MPLAVKLSRQFYEKLGNEVANELIDLLNVADENSRSGLRELLDARFERLDARFERIDARFERLEALFDARLEALQQSQRAETKAAIAQSEKTIIRWMFGF